MFDYSEPAAYKPTESRQQEWKVAKCLIMWLSAEAHHRMNMNWSRAEEFAVFQGQIGNEGVASLYPGRESVNGILTEKQIKQIKHIQESSVGENIDVKEDVVDELSPEEVYNRFCESLSNKGVCFYRMFGPLLSWNPMQTSS